MKTVPVAAAALAALVALSGCGTFQSQAPAGPPPAPVVNAPPPPLPPDPALGPHARPESQEPAVRGRRPAEQPRPIW